MATYTSHLNLKLPDYFDTADIKDLNDNFKKIDDAIASGSSGGGTGGGIVTETDPTVPSWAKQPQKPTYTAAEVGALPNTTVIPTVPNALPNPQPIVINGISYDGSERKEITVQAGDGGSITETDPTVPAWAKAATKPTYTAEEVGALPDTTVIPTVPSALKNPYPLTINGTAYDGSEAKTVNIRASGGGANIDDTTPSASTTYSSEKIEAELSKQKEAIDAKGDPTDEQVGAAVDEYLTAHPVSGISDAEKTILLALFQSAAYTADVSALITQLETMWSGSGEGGGDSGDEPVTPTLYIVTNKLTNVRSSNSTASVTAGAAYNATLTADDGYTLSSVTVTMGGADVTSSVYSGGVISIGSVTGNVVITANATANASGGADITQNGATLIINGANNVTQNGTTLLIA